jgi:hypothetical protein
MLRATPGDDEKDLPQRHADTKVHQGFINNFFAALLLTTDFIFFILEDKGKIGW